MPALQARNTAARVWPPYGGNGGVGASSLTAGTDPPTRPEAGPPPPRAGGGLRGAGGEGAGEGGTGDRARTVGLGTADG